MALWKGDNDERASRQTADETERLWQSRRRFLAEAAGMTLLGTGGLKTVTSPAQAAGGREDKPEKDKKSFLVTVHLVVYTPKEKVSVPEAREQLAAFFDSLQLKFLKPVPNGVPLHIYREGLPPRYNPLENLYPEMKPFIADLSSSDLPKVEQGLSQMDTRYAFRVVASLTLPVIEDRLNAAHRASKPILMDPDDPKQIEVKELFYACLLRSVSADGFITIEDATTITSVELDSGLQVDTDTGVRGPHEIKIGYPTIHSAGSISISRRQGGGGLKTEIRPGHILVKIVKEVK